MKDVSYLTDKELIEEIALLFAELMKSLSNENSLNVSEWAEKWGNNALMLDRIIELYLEIYKRS